MHFCYYLTLFAFIYMITCSIAHETHKGEQVWKIDVTSNEEMQLLQSILIEPIITPEREKTHSEYTEVYFRVGRRYLKRMKSSLSRHGFYFDVIISDVKKELDIEHEENIKSRQKRSAANIANFHEYYHNLGEIEEWMDRVAASHDFVVKEKLGESFERRDLHMLKISKPSNHRKPALYIDAATHAREWITPAVLMYVCDQILNETNNGNSVMLDHLDLYLVPVVNVDGYEFSWSRSSTRLWRKTRRTFVDHRPWRPNCVGVDANRNWNVSFGTGHLASSSRCSITYHGEEPESEHVVKHLANFIREEKSNIKGVISLHNYGQQILYPYNYNKTKVAPNELELRNVGNNMKEAIRRVHGRIYENGRGAKVLYVFSGSTSDWAYEKAGIPLSYTIELRDLGLFRFELPRSEIIPTGQEVMAAVQVMAKHLIENYSSTQNTNAVEVEVI